MPTLTEDEVRANLPQVIDAPLASADVIFDLYGVQRVW